MKPSWWTDRPGTADFWMPRKCLLAALPEHEIAARLLSEAADAILAANLDLARDFVRRADMPVLFRHASLVMSGSDPAVQRRRPVPPPLGTAMRIAARMPSSTVTRALFARDGMRCRFCDCRVVPPQCRMAMSAALPGAVAWSEAGSYHGAFYALTASVDHIVPHSVGGTNDAENLVTACWSCQFGRGAWSLAECGLLDPRDRPPLRDEWDGLERLLKRPATISAEANNSKACSDQRPSSSAPANGLKLSQAEWFACLNATQPTISSRLTSFVDTCSDLGMSWSLTKVLLVRMTMGDLKLDILGVQRDGLVVIPWSIGDAKDAFRSFAETFAAAIPGTEVYETPKSWVVSKPGKKRITVSELLDAASGLRRALEDLRSDLLRADG